MTARLELQRIATHVLARGQHAATGRLGLRASPGGFSSIPFGDDATRLRVSGTTLVRESAGSTAAEAISIAGRSVGQLAVFAQVDLATDFSAGADTPPVGDVDASIELDPLDVDRIATWFDLTARALDSILATAPSWAAPSIPQLWPEHFDLALDLAYDPADPAQRRVNLGGSPGDEHHPDPYLYVGPWTADRPGDPTFWNAPFGAVLGADRVQLAPDSLAAATEFFRHGLDRLAPTG